MNTKDNIVPKKSRYAQKSLDLIRGFWFIVLGLVSFLNLLAAETIGLLCSSILLLITIIEFIIGKRYKKIN